LTAEGAAPSGKVSPAINTVGSDGSGIEGSVTTNRVFVQCESKVKDWWERVGELQDAKSGDDTRNVAELGDSTRNDEGGGPINEDSNDPNVSARFACQTWEAKKFFQDVDIENLDSNVPVQTGCDNGRNKRDDISDRLPSEGG